MVVLATLAFFVLPGRSNSGLLPFAPLMQQPAGVAAEAWLRQCVNRAQQVPMDEILKANYLADLAILSGLVYRLETIMAIIAEETMYESSVVQYFTEKGIEQGGENFSSKCWPCALMRTRPSSWPGRLGPLAMCSASSSCIERPYRCPASKPLGTC